MRSLGLVAILAVVALAALLVTHRLGPGAGAPGDRGPAARGSAPPRTSEVLPRASGGGASTAPATHGPGPAASDALPPPARLKLEGAARSDRAALVRGPLPRDAVGRGRLVAGYPSRVFATVPSSEVGSSSVSSAQGVLQVALVATTTRSPDEVALFYRRSLTRLGFSETHVAGLAGSRSLAFSRARDSVAVTLTPRGTGTTYSLLGVLHAARG